MRKEKYDEARKYFTESLILRKELGNTIECALGILALSMIRIISRDHGQGLKLLSFAKNYFESNRLAIYKTEQESIEKYLSELKEKMSEEDFSGYFEYGKTMTLKEAMELAVKNER